MARSGPRKIARYGDRFKATAVKLSRLPGVLIKDVAEALDTHPFMLSLWRKQVRDGVIVAKSAKLDVQTTNKVRKGALRCGTDAGPLPAPKLRRRVSRCPCTATSEEEAGHQVNDRLVTALIDRCSEAGVHQQGRFYASPRTFHALENCNVWVARALQAAGVAVHPETAITAGTLLRRVRRLSVAAPAATR